MVAQDAWAALGLDVVLWMPAAVPPHKLDREVTTPALRLEMVRAAIAGDSRFRASDLEIRREGPSYTVETLRELEGYEGGADLLLLIGVDQFLELHTWKSPEEILRRCEIAVLSREGMDVDGGPAARLPHRLVPVIRIDVSSTLIRERVAREEPIRYLVPPEVEAIIRRENLYR